MDYLDTLNPNLYRKAVERRATRDGFGDGLVAAGEADERVVALVADLSESTRVEAFADRFPDRFIQVGVAEQAMVTVASGLAAAGKIPFAASYATFSPGRNWEQIRTTICYNDVPVKIVGSHAGVSVGPDGATHQALEDLALMRVLPNMTVIYPADALEAERATLAVATHPTPVYLRLARADTPVITTARTPFVIGRAELLMEGDDLTLIAAGPLLYQTLLAAKQLRRAGVSVRVLNCHTIKPLDERVILAAARKTGAIVTVEEHQQSGGLGGAVAELLARTHPTPQEFVGVADHFGESGSPDELILKFGLGTHAILEAAERALARRPRSRTAIDRKQHGR